MYPKTQKRVHIEGDMYPKMPKRVHVTGDMYPKTAKRVHIDTFPTLPSRNIRQKSDRRHLPLRDAAFYTLIRRLSYTERRQNEVIEKQDAAKTLKNIRQLFSGRNFRVGHNRSPCTMPFSQNSLCAGHKISYVSDCTIRQTLLYIKKMRHAQKATHRYKGKCLLPDLQARQAYNLKKAINMTFFSYDKEFSIPLHTIHTP